MCQSKRFEYRTVNRSVRYNSVWRAGPRGPFCGRPSQITQSFMGHVKCLLLRSSNKVNREQVPLSCQWPSFDWDPPTTIRLLSWSQRRFVFLFLFFLFFPFPHSQPAPSTWAVSVWFGSKTNIYSSTSPTHSVAKTLPHRHRVHGTTDVRTCPGGGVRKIGKENPGGRSGPVTYENRGSEKRGKGKKA